MLVFVKVLWNGQSNIFRNSDITIRLPLAKTTKKKPFHSPSFILSIPGISLATPITTNTPLAVSTAVQLRCRRVPFRSFSSFRRPASIQIVLVPCRPRRRVGYLKLLLFTKTKIQGKIMDLDRGVANFDSTILENSGLLPTPHSKSGRILQGPYLPLRPTLKAGVLGPPRKLSLSLRSPSRFRRPLASSSSRRRFFDASFDERASIPRRSSFPNFSSM